MDKQLPPLSLYIHIPWCERKCPYCDFNSHENKNSFSEENYISCLLNDLQQDLHLAQDRKLQSIFIGGGTPSLFSVENIDYLLKKIRCYLAFDENIEITLEANPASSQKDYFFSLSQTHVNRVSLGVQSFQPDKLSLLGRLHSQEQARHSLAALKKHFENFNIDLMFGLPTQSVEHAIFDLEVALSFEPKHLSWYQLTIEPNTIFYRDKPTLPDEETVFNIQESGKQVLTKNQLTQYEISAFAQDGWQSKHNLNYWLFGDYLAIGAGAHGKVTSIINDETVITRFQKKRMPKEYMNSKAAFIAKSEQVKSEELPLEFFMNALRLNQEIPLTLFYKRTGLVYQDVDEFCQKASQLKLIEIESDRIRKTILGQQHVDSILTLF